MKRTVSLIVSFIILMISVCSSFSCSSGGNGTGTPDPYETTTLSGPAETVVPAGKTFYVSPGGNDAGSGTEDEPLATPAGAGAAIAAYIAENGLPEGGMEAVFEEGRYPVMEKTVFGKECSGADGSPVVFRAAPGAGVIFDGGVLIDPSAFHSAPDGIKAKISDADAAENLLEVDLAAAGCLFLEDITGYSHEWFCESYRQELYSDGIRQTVARWPNTGYATGSVELESDGSGTHTVPDDKYELWAESGTARYFGYPINDFAHLIDDDIQFDDERSVIIIDGSTFDGINMSSYYYIFNVLCELDSPGEYFWDTASGKLYWYPDGPVEGRKISFSQFPDVWFDVSGSSYINFEGIVFENARTAVIFGSEDADHITADGCVFRDTGGTAVKLNGKGNTVKNCELYSMGAGGIYVLGGDPDGHVRSDTLITNNLFHDWAQTATTYNAALRLEGYGFTVSHNEMHSAPHQAIAFDCGESLIEYNYIHNVCTETSDAGAMYAGRRWDWSGNIIRYNLVKDIVDKVFGGDPNGIYLDDCLSGQTVIGNILVNITGNSVMCSGKYNEIRNNIIIGDSPIYFDTRGMNGDFMQYALHYPAAFMWRELRKVDYLSDVMRLMAPVNVLTLEQSGLSKAKDDPGTPSYNTVTDNIMYDEGRIHSSPARTPDITKTTGNVQSNVCYSEDPGFTDAAGGDYSLRSDSVVFRDIPGFESIPFSQIGIIEVQNGASGAAGN